MTGLDTTVLLALEIEEVPGHRLIRDHILTSSRKGTGRYALAPQVLQEFLHVATDPRRFQQPLSFQDALRRSRVWWNAEEVTRCHPGELAWDQTCAWLEEFRLGRKRILDTHLAATYWTRGIRQLATAKTDDFAIFGVFEFAAWADGRKS